MNDKNFGEDLFKVVYKRVPLDGIEHPLDIHSLTEDNFADILTLNSEFLIHQIGVAEVLEYFDSESILAALLYDMQDVARANPLPIHFVLLDKINRALMTQAVMVGSAHAHLSQGDTALSHIANIVAY
jgi:hypothetical protein